MTIPYSVRFGDNLNSIAQLFGITMQSLVQANNIDYPYYLYTGQNLNIPIEKRNRPSSDSFQTYSETAHATYDYSADASNNMDQQSIEKILDKKGTLQGNVLKFTFPRYDLKVNVGLVTIEPELALTSWMAFQPIGNKSMVMGDLVLLENEIDPVVSQLIMNGLEITALHNHLLNELPRIMYLHFSGIGDGAKLAQGLKNTLSVTRTPMIGLSASASLPQEYWSKVESIMGKKGNTVGRVIQFSFPRKDKIEEFGVQIPPSMGVSQAVNFQAEGQNAAVTGDFVLIANEVNPVIRILKQYGIAATALHNHMLVESPRLFFLHFWAVDNPEKLAYGIRQTLAQTNTVMPFSA